MHELAGGEETRQSMLSMIMLIVVGWALVAGVACLSVCAASAKFNHEAEQF
jgi:hypothetical protein